MENDTRYICHYYAQDKWRFLCNEKTLKECKNIFNYYEMNDVKVRYIKCETIYTVIEEAYNNAN